MSVRKSVSRADGPDDQLALEAADVGILRFARGAASLDLRGAARAQFGFDADPADVGIQDVLDRMVESDRLQIAAQLAAWGKGEPAAADLTVRISSDSKDRARSYRLRLVDRGEALLFVVTRAVDVEANLLRAASHALRSPLNALLGWVHVLSLKRPGDADVAGIATRLERSAKALLQTVNDLQDLDHLKRGKFRLEKRPFNLGDAIDAAMQAQSEAARLRELRIVRRSAAECDCSVDGDPNRLRQLFEHLLRNSIRHSEPNSEIEISCEREKTEIRVSIRDHGSGLTREQIETFFSDRPREVPMDSPGLGAGLTLAREIVARHRGALTAESRGSRQGVTVTVSLPVRIRDAQKKAG